MIRAFLFATTLALAAVLANPHDAAAQVDASASSIFINEFHYDNLGTDAGEAIEIALPTGTDISNLSVQLYNGLNGTLYNTTAASSGTLTNVANGFSLVVINYPVNGIQNGSPDGIALVNGGTVIQFLSYEGVFTATDGAASGLVSTDILVSETGGAAEPPGLSLQLQGTGNTFGQFTFAGPITSTFGATNTGQNFVVPVPEPATVLGLSALGLGALRLVRRRVIG